MPHNVHVLTIAILTGACSEEHRLPHKEAGWIQQECRSFETARLEEEWESGGGDYPLIHEGEVVARANVSVRYVFRNGERRIQSACVKIRPYDHELSYRPSLRVREDARDRELAIHVASYGPARAEGALVFPGYEWTLDLPLKPRERAGR